MTAQSERIRSERPQEPRLWFRSHSPDSRWCRIGTGNRTHNQAVEPERPITSDLKSKFFGGRPVTAAVPR